MTLKLPAFVDRKTERLTLVASLTIVLALAFAGVDRFVYTKAVARRAQLQTEATEVWHNLFVAQSQAARAAQAKAAAQEDAIALTSDPVLTAHTQITDLARTYDIHIVAVTPGASARVGETLRTPVTVSVDGSYANIVRFLGRVENSPLLMQVNGVTIGTEQGSGSRLTAQLAVLVITVPQDGGPTS